MVKKVPTRFPYRYSIWNMEYANEWSKLFDVVQRMYSEFTEKHHMPTSSDICVFCRNNCSSPEDLAAHIAEKHVRQVSSGIVTNSAKFRIEIRSWVWLSVQCTSSRYYFIPVPTLPVPVLQPTNDDKERPHWWHSSREGVSDDRCR